MDVWVYCAEFCTRAFQKSSVRWEAIQGYLHCELNYLNVIINLSQTHNCSILLQLFYKYI